MRTAPLTDTFLASRGSSRGCQLTRASTILFNFLLPNFHRFSKQYSKDYKAKEVSEGGETKDFWNVLGGKANFMSLSEGESCGTYKRSFPLRA